MSVMRTEQEMMDLIVTTAQADERIRVAIMNGSRANPNAPRDPFQDYDVVYAVTDVAPFKHNEAWIERFGELMILQMPEEMDDPPPEGGGEFFTYLMQFADGNRIDLGIFPVDVLDRLTRDSLSVLLLDKDGRVGTLPPASEQDYIPKPPAAKAFADCCNEFWWVCPYVAKGLWRQEFPYARYMLDEVVRPELRKMVAWHIGATTGWGCNPGKFGKYFQRHLEPELWALLLKTYAGPSYDSTWEALFAMGTLFRTVAVPLAGRLGLVYPHGDDARVTAHLEHVRRLPRDATEMY